MALDKRYTAITRKGKVWEQRGQGRFDSTIGEVYLEKFLNHIVYRGNVNFTAYDDLFAKKPKKIVEVNLVKILLDKDTVICRLCQEQNIYSKEFFEEWFGDTFEKYEAWMREYEKEQSLLLS